MQRLCAFDFAIQELDKILPRGTWPESVGEFEKRCDGFQIEISSVAQSAARIL